MRTKGSNYFNEITITYFNNNYNLVSKVFITSYNSYEHSLSLRMRREVKVKLYCIIHLSYVFCLLVTRTGQQKPKLQSKGRIKAKSGHLYKKGLNGGFRQYHTILVLSMHCPRIK